MKKFIYNALFISFLHFLAPCYAEDPSDAHNHWKCIAYDSAKKQWEVSNKYERVALNRALDDCKKQSNTPKSCAATEEFCEFFGTKEKSVENASSPGARANWQCTALDQTAAPWVGKISSDKDDAALDAKATCQKKSTEPDTCYINLLTCHNLNAGL